MSDLMNFEERVTLILQTSSNTYNKCFINFHDFDRKNLLDQIIQTIFAMGNTEGGHIAILKDNYFQDLTQKEILDLCISNTKSYEQFISVDEVEHEGKLYFYIQINKATSPIINTSGTYYKRKGPVNQCVELFESSNINRENEIYSIEYERKFVPGACYEDLDESLINDLISDSSNIQLKEPKKYLQQLNLIEIKSPTEFLITRAALLLFAKSPRKWHPKIEVRFTRLKNTELGTGEKFLALLDETEDGNIITLLKNSWEKLRPLMSETTFISKDKLFKTQILYPEDACYEALLNAIAHRDYSIQGSGIEIRIFEDKLQIISPGGLLSTINIEDLRLCKGVHESRNPYISRTLRELGYMRELGEGIMRIYDIMKKNDLKSPDLENNGSSFKVTLFHKFIYSNDEKKYLENFSELNLTKPEKDIIRLGLNNKPLSRSDIMKAAGLKSADDFQATITPIIKQGIIKILYNQENSRNLARRQRIPVKDLPRFIVLLPGQEEKYDKVQSERILQNNATGIKFGYVPNDIENDQLESGLKSLNCDFEFIKREKASSSNSSIIIYDLKSIESVRKVLNNKNVFTDLDSNIKVFPFVIEDNDARRKSSEFGKKAARKNKPLKKNLDRKKDIEIIKNLEVPDEFASQSIIVRNIPLTVSYNDILKFFMSYGRVLDLTINKNDKQCVFVKFEDIKISYYLISLSGELKYQNNILLINERIFSS